MAIDEREIPELEVGEPVELTELTGDWRAGTSCVVVRLLLTHAVVAVLDEEGRQVESVPVGYGSIGRRDRDAPDEAPRRRPVEAA